MEQRLKTIGDIAAYIKSEKCKNIVVLTGAGISTPCGIPDFRSPGTGVYANLQKYNLPYPEAVFEIGYFKKNPLPYFELRGTVIDAILTSKPSLAHYFIRLLNIKGKLLKICTQNIDDLENKAGIAREYICQAHGSLRSANCMDCKYPGNMEEVMQTIRKQEIPRCNKCSGVMKPNTVLFGESMPTNFFDFLNNDLRKCDLLIIMGTSLKVHPVASIPYTIKKGIPRLLINKEHVSSFDFVSVNTNEQLIEDVTQMSMNEKNDVFFNGTCDEGCLLLAKMLEWEDDLQDLYSNNKSE